MEQFCALIHIGQCACCVANDEFESPPHVQCAGFQLVVLDALLKRFIEEAERMWIVARVKRIESQEECFSALRCSFWFARAIA